MEPPPDPGRFTLGTTWADAGGTAQLDRTDPASFGIQIGTPANSSLSARPWVHFESAPVSWTLGATDGGAQTTRSVSFSQQSFLTWDSTITVDHHMQLNSNTFDAALDVTSRLTSDLGFVTFTLLNGRDELVDGVTVTETLGDDQSLVAPAVDRSVTTGANGRPLAPATWDSQLPGGSWTHTVTITAPVGLVGEETPPTAAFTLLAASPSLKVICEGGPAIANRAKHMTPDETQFQTFLGVMDVDTATTLSTLTERVVQSASVALFRVAPTGAAQYLNAAGTWTGITAGSPLDFHAMAETVAGSGVFVKTFTTDANWGTSDVVTMGKAVVDGTPYGGVGKEAFVGEFNGHDAVATPAPVFDVLDFAGVLPRM